MEMATCRITRNIYFRVWRRSNRIFRELSYSDTYCEGGKKFDRLLTELGAKRAGEIFEHDAKWIAPWIEGKLKPAMEK